MLANSDEGDNQKILGICAHEIYELIIKNRNIYFFDDKELYEKMATPFNFIRDAERSFG